MYLDANATTRLDADAFQAMLPWLRDEYGNPSSVHDAGKRARRAIEEARAQIAAAVGCHADEITFFSSATEATNAVIASAVAAARTRLAGAGGAASLKPLILTSPAEHECVLKPCEWLVQTGVADLQMVPVDSAGQLNLAALSAALEAGAGAEQAGPGRVALASFMCANNETGVLQDLTPVVAQCRARRVLVHTDAVQALGKIELHFGKQGVDYLTLAPHKCGGPKGVGILIARRVAPLEAWVRGGPQEGGIRGGTENVAAIVGAAVAVVKAVKQQPAQAAQWAPLRDALETRILAALPGAKAWGRGSPRVANTTFISVPGIEAEAALMQLSQRGVHAASGAACSSSEPEPSHVLLAMGASRAEAHGALRLSLPATGSDPTAAEALRAEDIPAAADTIIDVLRRLQAHTRQPGKGPAAGA